MTEHFYISLVVFFALGSFSGILSGLLGIGGGIIIVPCLAWLFDLYHFPSDVIMQMAAATSLAVMVVTMLRALLAHRRYQVEFWSIYKRWLAPVLIGVLVGVVAAHYMYSAVLVVVFAVVMIMLAIKLLFPLTSKQRQLPKRFGMTVSGSLIGVLSGMLGIGGGAFSIPYLVHYNITMRRALVVSIAVSISIATIGTILVIIMGWHQIGLPAHTIGYIYWPAWVGIIVGSTLFVPVGTALSHRLPVATLRRVLAIVLLFVGAHLLFRNI